MFDKKGFTTERILTSFKTLDLVTTLKLSKLGYAMLFLFVYLANQEKN